MALIAGWAVLLIALLVWGGSGAYLTFVDPSDSAFGRHETNEAPVVGVVLHALVVMVAALLCAGLPSQHQQPRVLWGAGGQVFGGFVAGVIAYAAFRLAAPSGGLHCRYDSCWPADAQFLAAFLPTAVLAVTMVVMGLLYRWVPWRVRAFAPVVVWGGLTLVQALVWHSWLLPMFQQAP